MVGNGDGIDGISKILGACDESGKLSGGLIVLYKVKGGGVHDFSFSEHWGPILKCPPK